MRHPAGDGGVLAGGDEKVDDGVVASLVTGGVEGDNVGKEGLGSGVVVGNGVAVAVGSTREMVRS